MSHLQENEKKMSDLTVDQIHKIITDNKNSFKAELTRLISYFVSHKTGMSLKLANAIAKGIVDKEVK